MMIETISNEASKFIMDNWRKYGIKIGEFTQVDVYEDMQQLKKFIPDENEAAKILVLAIRDAHNHNAASHLAIKKRIDDWLNNDLRTVEEVGKYVASRATASKPKTFNQINRETLLEQPLAKSKSDEVINEVAKQIALRISNSEEFKGAKYSWPNDEQMRDRVQQLATLEEFRGEDYVEVKIQAEIYTRQLLHWQQDFQNYFNDLMAEQIQREQKATNK